MHQGNRDTDVLNQTQTSTAVTSNACHRQKPIIANKKESMENNEIK